jgi:hypothetical protein
MAMTIAARVAVVVVESLCALQGGQHSNTDSHHPRASVVYEQQLLSPARPDAM